MVKIGVFQLHFLMGTFQTRDILYLDVKTQDVRHVLDFLHQSILYKQNIIFLIYQKTRLVVNPII